MKKLTFAGLGNSFTKTCVAVVLAFGTIPFAGALEHFGTLGALSTVLTKETVTSSRTLKQQNIVLKRLEGSKKTAVLPAAKIGNDKLKKSEQSAKAETVRETVGIVTPKKFDKVKDDKFPYFVAFFQAFMICCIIYAMFFKNTTVKKRRIKGMEKQETIIVNGAESAKHMSLAFFAVDEFNKWEMRHFKDEYGVSPAMKISIGEKWWFRGKKLTHDIFVSKWPNGFHVEFIGIKKNRE